MNEWPIGRSTLPPLPRHLDQICDRFEIAWKKSATKGSRPHLEDYLAGVPEPEQQLLLLELLLLEIDYRQKLGDTPALEEYQQRFPTLPSEWMIKAFSTKKRSDVPSALAEDPKETPAPDGADPSTNDPYATEYPDPPPGFVQPGDAVEPAAAPSLDDPFATVEPAPPPAALAEAPTIPGYQILKELGRGGMGVVYLARQHKLNRVVALKMIRAGGTASPVELERFRVEAEAVARCQHPNIVQIFECGEHQGLPYFTLEYVAGGSLSDKIRQQMLLPGEAALVVEQLARGMAYAHARGIIHRDLKPANVLLAGGSEPTADQQASAPPVVAKITDFGLAKRIEGDPGLTGTGAVLGTAPYMAPEQARGRTDLVGQLSDIYALGAILYQLLTGRPPFQAATVMDTLLQVMEVDPVPPAQLQPKVPRDLETICLKCLQKDPQKRYAKAEELAKEIQRFLKGDSILARPPSLRERLLKWAWRKPAAAALVGVSLLALVALLASVSLYALYASQQVSNSERKLEAIQALQTARERSRRALLGAQQHEATGNLDAAHTVLVNIQETLQANPELRDDLLGTEVHRSLVAVRQKQRDRDQGLQAKKRRQDFQEPYEDVLFFYTLFTALDPAENLANTQAAARKALAIYGLTAEPAGATDQFALLKGDQDHHSGAEYTRLVGACYELLLIWAETEASARPGQAEPGQAEAAKALKLLDRAARLGEVHGLDSRTYHLHRARFLAQSGKKLDPPAKKAVPRQPQGRLDWFLTSLEQYRTNQFAEAIDSCEQILRQQNDDPWAHYVKALCQMRQGQWVHAQAELTVCLNLKLKRGFVWPRLLRGFAASEEGFQHTQSGLAVARVGLKGVAAARFNAAEEDFNAALREEPNNKLVRYVGLVNRGVLNIRRQRWKEAVEDLEKAVKVNKNGLEGFINLAIAHQGLEKLEEGVAVLGQAVELAPKLSILYESRANLHLLRKDWTKARKDFQQAIDLDKDTKSDRKVTNLVKLGELLHQESKYKEALTNYDLALKLKPNYALVQSFRYLTLLALEQPTAAGVALDQYLKATNPAPAEVYQARGLIYARTGKRADAIRMYTLALAQNPKDTTTRCYRGWLYLLTDAVQLGLEDFEECLREEKNNVDALNVDALIGRGYAHIRQGRLDEALEDCRLAAKKRVPYQDRQLYFLARLYALAAGQLELTPRTGKARQDQSVGQRLAQCKENALEYLKQAVEKQLGKEQKAAFWRDQVQPDPAFTSIRREGAYSVLAGKYAGKGRKNVIDLR